MKKILSIVAASGLVAACGGSKKDATTKVANACPTNAVTITKDPNLNSVKFITDGGSVNDKSFNNAIWNGVKKYTGSGTENYVIPKANNAKDRQIIYKTALTDTQLLVLGGYQHSDALKSFCSSIEKNRGIIYIDAQVVKSSNVNSIIFKTEEGAFYAGYLSAKYLSENKSTYDTKGSEGLKVGTYGGMNLKTVTAFMGGFQQGVEFWNANLKDGQTKVEFIKLGTSLESYFSGNFKAGRGKAISEKLVNKGADIILPVAGFQTLDTLKVIEEKGTKTLVVGVDTDQVTRHEGHENRFFTSVLKKMDEAVYNAIQVILNEKTDTDYGLGKTTIATVDNNLIGLADSGDNKIAKGEYELAKEDAKISAAAKKATNVFKA